MKQRSKITRAAAIALALIAVVWLGAFATLCNRAEENERQKVEAHVLRQFMQTEKPTPNPYEQLALEVATTPNTPDVDATEPEPESLGTFQLTAYCACEICCGDWADGVTYTGTQATAGRTVAVDPDVIPLGASVYINGQEYVAEDIGGAIQGNRVDVYFDDHADALEFGVQYAEVQLKEY